MRLCPKNGFSVLRKPVCGNVWYSVDASPGSFDPAALRQPGQNRVGEARVSGLFGGEQAVVFLGEGDQFVESGSRRKLRLSGCSLIVKLVPQWNCSDTDGARRRGASKSRLWGANSEKR